MTTAEKVRENRVRRAADRQGYILVKSRRRDPRALDYGRFVLVENRAGNRSLGGQAAISEFADSAGYTLDEIEARLWPVHLIDPVPEDPGRIGFDENETPILMWEKYPFKGRWEETWVVSTADGEAYPLGADHDDVSYAKLLAARYLARYGY